MNNIDSYIERLEKNVYGKISDIIIKSSVDKLVYDNLQFHIINLRSVSFQKYYFQTVNNKIFFLNHPHFFRDFKFHYALQGIDNIYIDLLEKNKPEILNLISEDKLAQLYFKYFFKVKLKYGKSFITKDLGSFFAKLVHTFKPKKYCALDNPIKQYFGLSKESFFISFNVLSNEYVKWARNNGKILENIKIKLNQIDKKKIINQNKLTYLKLLDLIFWKEANIKK
jgi:hypothetical protein